MMEKLREMEVARQEMKRQAFLVELEGRGFNFTDKSHDEFGFNDETLNIVWEMWQAAQEQMLHGRWISVIDQLPPSDEMVLICWADNPEIEPEKDFMDICTDTGCPFWANYLNDMPTHWQPLPQPPKQ